MSYGCGIHTGVGQKTLGSLTTSASEEYRMIGYLVRFWGLCHIYSYIKYDNALLLHGISQE